MIKIKDFLSTHRINYKKVSWPILIIILIIWQSVTFYGVIRTSQKISEGSESINQKISDIETILLAEQENNTTLTEALEAAKEKAESLSKEFEKVSDDVDDLEKITQTDPELLQKYSKVYFLNEHYAPADLETIDSEFTFDKNKDYEIHDEVWPYLEDLLEDAKDDGMDLLIISAYRSFLEQTSLKGLYTVTYGVGTANQFSADQGYSEHQLGTAVDFTNPEVGSTFTGFSKTEEYEWLLNNAYKYGFILSYPEGNQYYQYEPWHWRFVGERLAKKLHKNGTYFYDTSQREIDEYLLYLFD